MKVGLLSLGCPKNLVDGEVMLGLAEQAGHEITPDAGEADVLVVNTCAFIDSAKQESIDAILEMAGHKRDGRCRRLVVTGCLAERYRDELKAQIPEIDAVLGTGEVPEIVRALDAEGRLKPAPTPVTPVPAGVTPAPVTFFRKQHPEPGTPHPAPRTRHPAPDDYLYDAATPRHLTTPRHYAYVKVAEGCDYTCSFCIIPTLRGHYRSRPAESIVQEARSLAARGVREINLVSQDTSFYGVDRRERGELSRLLRELNRVDGLAWIRMLYLYPTTITDGVLDAMVECDRVCRYVDLPLQHASPAVLKRMRRPGTRRTYERLLRRIRDRVPGVALRTTFIVGFPGETKADFAELESFVRDIAFDHVGVFTYSHEEGTRAHALDDDVPARTKQARRNRLMSLQRRIVSRRQGARLGERVQVLVDGPSAESPLVAQGRLEGQAPEIDPVVYLTDCDPTAYAPGALVAATVVGARDYDLVARPLP
jgi:ribosomal protein S12 methylthiotransferase